VVAWGGSEPPTFGAAGSDDQDLCADTELGRSRDFVVTDSALWLAEEPNQRGPSAGSQVPNSLRSRAQLLVEPVH
jgi:hypothetical protein